MENLDPPVPPPPPKSRMGKWRVFGLRAASSLIWAEGGLLFHFMLSKIVADLRTCPAIRPFSPIRSLVASNLNVLKRSHHE